MNTTAPKILCIVMTLLLTACAGGDNPIALEPVTPDPENPILDLIDKLNPDGPTAGPITLYQAVIAQGVPSRVAKVAFEKYDKFSHRVRNRSHIAMLDFTQHSGRRRFYFVNRKTGAVEQWPVAHGVGSDPGDTGYGKYYSNVPNSRMSSLGSYLIQEKYVGKYGDSMRLDGLESTNNNARARAIVLHPSNYVRDGSSKQGRSWGCPAIPYTQIQSLIRRSRDGSFMYIYGINRRSTAHDLQQILQWNMLPKSMWVDESEAAPFEGE